VARLLGDQRQQQQFQITGGEDPWAASTAFTAGAFFKAVTAVAVFAMMMGGMMVSHFSFSLVVFRYNLRYILMMAQAGLTNGTHLIHRMRDREIHEIDQKKPVLNRAAKVQISANSLMSCFALYSWESVVHVLRKLP